MIHRIYIDTSVFGGHFDEEFAEHTIPLFVRLKDNEKAARILGSLYYFISSNTWKAPLDTIQIYFFDNLKGRVKDSCSFINSDTR